MTKQLDAILPKLRSAVAAMERLDYTEGVAVLRSGLDWISSDSGERRSLTAGDMRNLVIELTQLRGNLSLAEQGLANYALEVQRLRNDIQELTCGDPGRVSGSSEPGACTFPTCGHRDVTECSRIGAGIPPDGAPSMPYCPNCDCDYCGSVKGRLERGAKSEAAHEPHKYATEGPCHICGGKPSDVQHTADLSRQPRWICVCGSTNVADLCWYCQRLPPEVVARDAEQRERLAQRLAGRPVKPIAIEDIGIPHLREDAADE
jgi:hypothetical protein